MMKFRRIGAMVAATVAATGMAMTVTTAPAVAAPKPKGPTPVSTLLPAVNEMTKIKLISVAFKTDVKACNFKLVVKDFGDTNTWHPGLKPYTSLYDDSTLSKKEVDFANFFVSTGDYKPGWSWQLIPSTLYYDTCGKKAKLQSKNIWFVLPVKGAPAV